MNMKINNNMFYLSLSLVAVVCFQNCGKSQFQTQTQIAENPTVEMASSALASNSNLASAEDVSEMQFEKIYSVTVDSNSDNVYFASGSKLYVMDKNRKVSMINKNENLSDYLSFYGIEVDPLTQSTYSIEYHTGVFFGVKKFSLDGSSDYVLTSDKLDLKNGRYYTQKSSSSSSWINFGSNPELLLVRVGNVPLLRLVTSSGQYLWINLKNKEIIDAFAMNCMRTGDCGTSANLISLTLSAQTIPLNWTDSKGNNISKSNCQILIVNSSEYLGKPCAQ